MDPELGFTDDKFKAYVAILNLMGFTERDELHWGLNYKAEEIKRPDLFESIENFYKSVFKDGALTGENFGIWA